jgi:hypothetical protein
MLRPQKRKKATHDFHCEQFLRLTVQAISNTTPYGTTVETLSVPLVRYAIINLEAWKSLDCSRAPPPRPKWLIYNSFGVLNDLDQRVPNRRGPGGEQTLTETNCGARAIAWLMMFECFPKEATSQSQVLPGHSSVW